MLFLSVSDKVNYMYLSSERDRSEAITVHQHCSFTIAPLTTLQSPPPTPLDYAEEMLKQTVKCLTVFIFQLKKSMHLAFLH